MSKQQVIKAVEVFITNALEKEKLDVSGLDNKELRNDISEWLNNTKEMYAIGLDELTETED